MDDLPTAWAFVMAHLDDIGADPTISITPRWEHLEDGSRRYFEVLVEGMTEEVE